MLTEPSTSALEFLKRKKLAPSFDYRDVWQQEHSINFTVTKAMQLDVLEDINSAIIDAVAEGKTLYQFKKDLTPTLVKKGWWGEQEQTDPLTGEKKLVQLGSPHRLKTIYRTNMRTARAAGQWGRADKHKKTHPYLLYELGPSQNHRDEHVGWAGIILPIDDPWWQTHYPPNGFGCKCRVRSVSKHEYQDLIKTKQYLTTAPSITLKEWINKRTGEVEHIPQGIHPAFAYHIGQHRDQQSHSIIRNKINASESDLALGIVDSLVMSQVFKSWHAQPATGSSFVIGALDVDLTARLGAKQRAVLISDQTLAKQQQRHPELSLDEYQLIPKIINDGTVVLIGADRVHIYETNKHVYKLVVKTTTEKHENYITTFHRGRDKQLSNDIAKGELIRGEE